MRCQPDMCPNGGGQLLAEDWLNKGWNVGVFYWDQFADEECARDAEQKVWFDRKGDGFRWKSYDVGSGLLQYNTYEQPGVVSVADMCVENVKNALGKFSGPQVRFVGHSLGAQLATRCAALLHAENHVAAPNRLTLLEPYFSKHSHLNFLGHGLGCNEKVSSGHGLGDFASENVDSYVQKMWDSYKVVTEVYKSSVLTESDGESAYSQLKSMVKSGASGGLQDTLVGTMGGGNRNLPLERMAALVEYKPDWCSGVAGMSGDMAHLGCRHCAVFPMYFLSFGRQPAPVNPPPIAQNSALPGSALRSCVTPSAACTDGQVREWVERQFALQGGQAWTQVAGESTFDLSDDSFAVNPSLDDNFQLGLKSANEMVLDEAIELPMA
ncbi:unnamed protein product [Polarella glacialis]|uniref:Fungal lipase-type domain-containing protein n=1 Tax=Polarella glacialis TaxID=89957 RepID=A0A813GUR5_POLGL|nr:unnamed protein product [Polarella glacialis]